MARANITDAGLEGCVELRPGGASPTLQQLAEQGRGSFDSVFIDADKRGNPAYLEWVHRLSRRGTLIVADNVVRGGRVTDPDSSDSDVGRTRRFCEMLGQSNGIEATAIQTVGPKGWGGLVLALVARPAAG